MPLCLCARAPLAPALRGRAATQPCLTVARASPLRVGGGCRRAGAGVRRGEERCVYVSVRTRALPRAGGVGGAAEAFPGPRRSRSRASSGSPPAPATRVRSRRVCCAGTVVARLVLGGRSARGASPRPGRTGQMNGWAAGGEAAAAPLWLLRVARVTFPRWRGALAARREEASWWCAWEDRNGVPGRRGAALVCLWRWDPRVCLPGGPCPGPAPCLDVRPLPCAPGRKRGDSRSSRPGVRGGGRGRWAAGPGAPPREVG